MSLEPNVEIFSFERLEVYQESMNLVNSVYTMTDKFPSHEKYGLYSQLHRSIISVPSNIAESCGRISYKEKIHFIEIAYGSLLESYCQIKIALSINYITKNDVDLVKPMFFTVSRLLTGLRKSYIQHLTPAPKPLNNKP